MAWTCTRPLTSTAPTTSRLSTPPAQASALPHALHSDQLQARDYAHKDPRGRELATLVKLVDEWGTPVLGAALARCSTTEDGADLVVYTAH
jgi:hypothetical protein